MKTILTFLLENNILHGGLILFLFLDVIRRKIKLKIKNRVIANLCQDNANYFKGQPDKVLKRMQQDMSVMFRPTQWAVWCKKGKPNFARPFVHCDINFENKSLKIPGSRIDIKKAANAHYWVQLPQDFDVRK